MRFVVEFLAQALAKQFLVQILVVVAHIQMRTLKAEVEKGSMWLHVNRSWTCAILS